MDEATAGGSDETKHPCLSLFLSVGVWLFKKSWKIRLRLQLALDVKVVLRSVHKSTTLTLSLQRAASLSVYTAFMPRSLTLFSPGLHQNIVKAKLPV